VTRLGRVVFYDYDEIQFAIFLPGDARVRRTLMQEHAASLDADHWQAARTQSRGRLDDIFPYDTTRRFVRTARGAGAAPRSSVPIS